MKPGQPSIPIPDKFRVGTLAYTRMGLVGAFFWLLWGDFCFTLMETAGPSLMPLLLREYGASNREIAIMVTSITSVLNCVITPIVNVKSDRHRGSRGRRIPFLLWPTPFIALFLGAIPFAPEIAGALGKIHLVRVILELSPSTPIILVCGLLITLFQIFNMVMSSVYYTLFKDVVPDAFMGRFLSLFRVFGFLASAVYNYFIFGLAEHHMREIFVGISVLYVIGFGLMCWRVREGEYPPPPPLEKGPGMFSAVRTFFHESFSQPIYLWVYAARALASAAVLSDVFAIFFTRDELGISLDAQGKLNAWLRLGTLPLAYFFGIFIDRWKPQKAIMLATILPVIANVVCFYLVRDWNSLVILGVIFSPFTLFYSIALSVWTQHILPQDRFGQFAAALSLTSAAVLAVGAPLCGLFFDWIEVYRYTYLWFSAFMFLSFLCLCKVWKYWVRYGGPDHYCPPL
ncbi:MAG: hypothetical protein ACOYMV_05835 [Verrucomicrobiia bacterium]